MQCASGGGIIPLKMIGSTVKGMLFLTAQFDAI
jgi:hypothetical protein